MEDIIICNFKKEDIEEIAKVMEESFNSIGQDWSKEDCIGYIKENFDQAANFIAKYGNLVVGFVVADRHFDHLFINAIGVLPEYSGKGIAKKMWSKVQEYCDQNKIKQIKMIADPKSLAYEWYCKMGFKQTGWVELLLELDNK